MEEGTDNQKKNKSLLFAEQLECAKTNKAFQDALKYYQDLILFNWTFGNWEFEPISPSDEGHWKRSEL